MSLSIFFSGLIMSLILTIPAAIFKEVLSMSPLLMDRVLMIILAILLYLVFFHYPMLKSKRSFDIRAMKIPFSCALLVDNADSN